MIFLGWSKSQVQFLLSDLPFWLPPYKNMLCHGGWRVLQMMPQVMGLRFARVPVEGIPRRWWLDRVRLRRFDEQCGHRMWAPWRSHGRVPGTGEAASLLALQSFSVCTVHKGGEVVRLLVPECFSKGWFSIVCKTHDLQQHSWRICSVLYSCRVRPCILCKKTDTVWAASVERRVGTYSPTTSSKLWSIFSHPPMSLKTRKTAYALEPAYCESKKFNSLKLEDLENEQVAKKPFLYSLAVHWKLDDDPWWRAISSPLFTKESFLYPFKLGPKSPAMPVTPLFLGWNIPSETHVYSAICRGLNLIGAPPSIDARDVSIFASKAGGGLKRFQNHSFNCPFLTYDWKSRDHFEPDTLLT